MRYYTGYRVQPIRGRRYGLSNFVGDFILSLLTGGLWFIWICIRELKR